MGHAHHHHDHDHAQDHDHDHGHRHGQHGHDHGHEGFGHHHHAPANFDRAFAIGTALNIGFVAAELGFGILAGSLALMADAVHNFSDVIGLLLAWCGAWLGRKGPTANRTWGYGRASILAALANAALLLIAVGAIGAEAIQRLMNPAPIASATVMWVAALGILVNGATAMLFMRGHEDINIRGAFLHMAADAAVSLAVVIGALMMRWTGALWIDPALSLLVAVVILVSGWDLAKRSVNLAMDAVPQGIDIAKVEAHLRALPGVSEVHDLHIWAMSTTQTALTAHLVRPDGGLDYHFLAHACASLQREFGIAHPTLQIEHGDPVHPCPLAPAHVI